MDADLIKRVAERYESTSARMYARGKLGSDPICDQLVALGRERGGLGSVVDIGCGRGQMAVMLLEARVCDRVVGVDWDEPKLEVAKKACRDLGDGRRDLPATFEKFDVREVAPPACDTLLLIDVLHYLTDKQQIEVLERCMQSAKKCVVLRELDPDRGWRSATTRMQESVTTFFGYNVGERVRVLPVASFTEPLERAGFSVKVLPSWGKTPFSNVAIIAEK